MKSGLFFSATTNIDSSLFGLDPDPFESKFAHDYDQSVEGGAGGGHDTVSSSRPVSDSHDSSSLLQRFKNVFTRLGVKLGYLRKPQPHPHVLHDFQDGDEFYEFQCMTAEGQPVLVDGHPVSVHQPEDCSQYFVQGQSQGHATLMDPPQAYVEAAKAVFKSKLCG